MLVVTSLSEIKKQVEALRGSGKVIGFIPTMGALHEGHLTLLRTAAQDCDVTVCSIFVNPTQFNNPEDYRLYPRFLEEDAALLEANGCNILFAPEAADMYSDEVRLKFDFGTLETVMEGEFRPGHFTGVATVVSKLFHLVKPHKAYFGQKDLQQFAIIRQLVLDLSFDLELVCHPIIRETDGLAMSSRNRRLNSAEREVATHLYKALQLGRDLLADTSVQEIKTEVAAYLRQFSGVTLEYFEIVDVHTLQPVANLNKKHGIALCLAAYVGPVRLIDNIVIA